MITVHHLAPKNRRHSIMENGLIPYGKEDGLITYSPRIFVSISAKDLAFDYVNYENVDCWTFSVPNEWLKEDTFSSSMHHFFIETAIPPQLLILEASY